MRTRYVYITKNMINGKRYIGQRLCPVGVSLYEDNYLGSGTLLLKAFKKHKRMNFKKSIIAVCHSQKMADIIERYFIDYYGANSDRDNWYNIDCGGQYERADNHSKVTSKAMKKYHASPENRCATLAKRFGVSYEEYRLYINRRHLISVLKKYRMAKRKQESIFKKINRQIEQAHKLPYWETPDGIKMRKELSEKQKRDPEFKKKVQKGKDEILKDNPNFYSRNRGIEERIKQARSKLDPANILYLHNLVWDNKYTFMMLPENINSRARSYLRGYKSLNRLGNKIDILIDGLESIGIKADRDILISEAIAKSKEINRERGKLL